MNTELTDAAIEQTLESHGLHVPHFTTSRNKMLSAVRAAIAADRALQDARHAEELAAYDLTVSNLRAAQLPTSEFTAQSLFDHIAHGDADHRDWLERELNKWLETHSAPRPPAQGGPAGFVLVPVTDLEELRLSINGTRCRGPLWEIKAVNSMLAAAPCAGCGETCKRAKLCATCAGEIAAAQPPQPPCDCRKMGDPDQCDERAGCRVIAHFKRGAAQPERGQIVVTKNEAGQIVAVTRQDEEGKILEVIAMDIRFEREPEPAPTSVSLSKRAKLEADGYVVNGVAMMHPETRRRVLLDYCGFVGWWHGQVHNDQQAQQTDTVDAYATPEESASVTRQATPFESWLDEQMERIDPDRNEMGSAGHTWALIALVREFKQAKDDAPAWRDAPTCAGLWICDEASDLKYEWRAHRVTWPLNSMLLGDGERWYGPIPEDGK